MLDAVVVLEHFVEVTESVVLLFGKLCVILVVHHVRTVLLIKDAHVLSQVEQVVLQDLVQDRNDVLPHD